MKIGFSLVLVLILCTFSLFTANLYVLAKSKSFVYSELEKVPAQKTVLLLGTSKFLKSGQENLYYRYRIDACISLYKSGKVKLILISGDNSTSDYDEPTDMKNDLISAGIPEKNIYLDYAGFRTLDSVVRAKEVFGQESFIIVSQEFHTERAVFIARTRNINAFGFNAQDVTARYGFKTRVREYFARVKVLIDNVFDVQPKFLGEKILLP